jgi:23S rRNA (adenine2503-C2)-methyltransferase
MSRSFYQMTLPELEALFGERGLPPSGPALMFNWHYKKRRVDPCLIDLAKESIAFVRDYFEFYLPTAEKVQESPDGTVKFLLRLADGLQVETVLIPFNGKYTVCLSSQVGCAMKCSFCYTGTQGLKRHLGAEEIVGQFMAAKLWLSSHRPGDDRVLNIVFMGQGEPLHNFDAVKKAVEIFLEKRGLCIAPHKITISTAGYLPGLSRWKTEMPPVNIAVSLHSPIESKRNELIPINQRYPLAQVMELAEAIPQGRTRFVTYEYLLAENFNDSDEDAHATGTLLKGRNAYVSLIPFNPFPQSDYRRPSPARVEAFKRIMDTYGVPTLIRKTKGDEILAACGQLNTKLNSNV